jgi:hypothetical protein
MAQVEEQARANVSGPAAPNAASPVSPPLAPSA